MGKLAVLRAGAACCLLPRLGFAQDEVSVDISPQAPEAKAITEAPLRDQSGEPPPERPRRPGVVLESSLGMLGFGGNFRHVAPPAYWVQGQLGYEFSPALMLFAEAEGAWTDTSESQEEAATLPIVLWGFGGGLRATVHMSSRAALFGQAEVGALTADVKHDELTVLGFRNAESANLSLGARIGAEWYQVDRHLALLVAIGGRYAEGFAKVVGPTDVPLIWDAGLGVRYTF